ncbi:MAG: peptidoglycan editing factor PgeF [Acidobacteria bacterium]|nr:peptidoglycan editing factor PgeF [Acidobacteriota bacterium]
MSKSGAGSKQSSLTILSVDHFPTWGVHGFSTRPGGVSNAYCGNALNLGFTREDTRDAVEHNRTTLLRELGCERWPLVTLRQVHSDVIHNVTRVSSAPLTGDGLVTDTSGILLAVQTADCLPVLLLDVKHHAVGAFHAGWRGTLARIIEKGIGVMRRDFGTDPADIHAAIGPGIGVCCYEVGDEVRDKFAGQFPYAVALFQEFENRDAVREKYPLMFMNARAPGHGDPGHKLHLDLGEANLRQLLSAGVKEENIRAVAMCTACRQDLFFSYRVAKGPTGRQLGLVGIRP